MIRRAVYAASLAILAAALVIVPLPVLVVSPGIAAPVADPSATSAVVVVDAPDPISGRILFTAVQVAEAPTVQTVRALFDPAEEVLPATGVIPPGANEQDFIDQQRQIFDESVRVAAAVGLRAAGRQVDVSGDGARVAGVIPGSPADGVLQRGDVIVEANGRRIDLAAQLVAATSQLDRGDTLKLTVQRGGQTITPTVTLGTVSRLDRPGVGVLLSTVDQQIDLPVDIHPSDQLRIGGPSAGLMIALTVYDLYDPGDLTHGQTVAGTGTLDLEGHVGMISGIRAKVETAIRSGATVFLAPKGQVEDARAQSNGRMTVVGVSTLQDAIAAVQQQTGG